MKVQQFSPPSSLARRPAFSRSGQTDSSADRVDLGQGPGGPPPFWTRPAVTNSIKVTLGALGAAAVGFKVASLLPAAMHPTLVGLSAAPWGFLAGWALGKGYEDTFKLAARQQQA